MHADRTADGARKNCARTGTRRCLRAEVRPRPSYSMEIFTCYCPSASSRSTVHDGGHGTRVSRRMGGLCDQPVALEALGTRGRRTLRMSGNGYIKTRESDVRRARQGMAVGGSRLTRIPRTTAAAHLRHKPHKWIKNIATLLHSHEALTSGICAWWHCWTGIAHLGSRSFPKEQEGALPSRRRAAAVLRACFE